MEAITSQRAARFLPILKPDANKYTRGVCELVVGSERFAGAAVLAAKAANRMGAGYVKVYACDRVAAALHAVQPSSVVLPTDEFAACAHEQDERHPRAVVVGCGMQADAAGKRLTIEALAAVKAPVLVDGGGLAALSCDEGIFVLERRFSEGLATVITPHAGEAARLVRFLNECGVPGFDALRVDSAYAALALARACHAICVLKGPNTFIATGCERTSDDVAVMAEGTPVLAKAGTGDILAGAIGALLAQGCDPLGACIAATFVHARSGILAAADTAQLCVTAEDIIDHLAPAVASLEREALEEEGNPL